MRTVFRLVDPDGKELPRLEPWVTYDARVLGVRLLPSIGDPDDPDDFDGLEVTVEVGQGSE